MTNFKLDAKDLKLINQLEKNSRSSISQIAKAIGVSKEVANYRFNKLINSGFMKSFNAIIDYFSLGFDICRLLINLHDYKEGLREEIITELKKHNNVEFNILLQSNWDIEIKVRVRRTSEFYEFYDRFAELFSEHIQDSEFSIITKAYILKHSYLHGSHEIITFNLGKIQKIDENDYKILKFLEADPRISIIELYKKSGIPPSTLKYKIKNLISKKIFRRVIPILDVSLLGYNSYKVDVSLKNPAKRKMLTEYLIAKPNITRAFELMGEKDVEFEVDFKTTLELDNFLKDLSIKVPYISNFDVMPLLKI